MAQCWHTCSHFVRGALDAMCRRMYMACSNISSTNSKPSSCIFGVGIK